MPKEIKRSLMKRAKELGLGKARTGAYVYGTMQKIEKAKKGKK